MERTNTDTQACTHASRKPKRIPTRNGSRKGDGPGMWERRRRNGTPCQPLNPKPKTKQRQIPNKASPVVFSLRSKDALVSVGVLTFPSSPHPPIRPFFALSTVIWCLESKMQSIRYSALSH